MSRRSSTASSTWPLASAARTRLERLRARAASQPQQGSGFAEYRDEPARYFSDVLGVEPWSRQREILDALAAGDRVAVRSGHKTGKSCSAVGVALWWACTRDRGRVIMTSAGRRQVKLVLWHELRTRYRAAEERARTHGLPSIGGTMHLDPGTGLTFGDERGLFGFTTDDPERMAGFSGDQLLFIIDEASGFPDEIFEAVMGNAAGGVKILLLGNPTQTQGFFHDIFRSASERWARIHVSSEESPNVLEGRAVVPGLATRDWVEEMREECAPDPDSHPVYQVRVRGEFPDHASNSVVSIAALSRAQQRGADAQPDGNRVRIGLDVARYGDDETVLIARRGRYVYPAQLIGEPHGQDIAEAAVARALDLREVSDEPPVIAVDGIGVGASTVDYLQRHPVVIAGQVLVLDVNVGESADDGEHVNLRSQLYFAAASFLQQGGTAPPDQRLEQELLAHRYTFDERGRKKVEPKKAIKARLKRSPDRSDAYCLAVYEREPLRRLGATGDRLRTSHGPGRGASDLFA